jgi:hypothetical protein
MNGNYDVNILPINLLAINIMAINIIRLIATYKKIRLSTIGTV